MQTIKSELHLPNSGPIHYISPTLCAELYKRYMKSYVVLLSRTYNNFNQDEMLLKIDKVNEIRINPDDTDVNETCFEDGCLYLPKCFFRRNIKIFTDIASMLEEYPDLIDILKIHVFTLCSTYSQDTPRDKRIKELISTFYTQDGEITLEYALAEKTFPTFANISPLQCNIIQQLSNLLGLDVIKETLKYGAAYLESKIDTATGKKGQGKKIVDSILKIDSLAKEEECYTELDALNHGIKNKLLKPLYSSLKEHSQEIQSEIVNLIDKSDYHVQSINLLLGTKLSQSEELTDEEKETIKSYCMMFDQHFIELAPFYETEFPKITCTKNRLDPFTCDIRDFTPINKVLTVIKYMKYIHDKQAPTLLNEWKKLQKTLIFKVLPRMSAKKEIRKEYFDFDTILELSMYYGEKDEFELSQKRKVKKLEATVNKRM